MTESGSSRLKYRDPYPDWKEKLRWLWVRYFTDREVPPKAWVQLRCPEAGETFATEHTDAVEVDRDVEGGTGIWTYECGECGDRHSFLWGPPAPIRVEVDSA